ncbi:hypothetical protein [Fibrella aquatica]|uniref:hypothetical protein n=1 Tax=Fibrella aquatica TaxID=3242487 RepID=UPI003520833F
MTFSIQSFLLFLCLAGSTGSLLAQGRVSNVRMRAIDQQSVEVFYDLRNSTPTDSIYVRLQRRNGSFIAPELGSVSGDLGTNRIDGREQRIVWNLRRNGLLLREEVRAVVLIKPGVFQETAAQTPVEIAPSIPDATTTEIDKPYRGPAWALLSLLAPGVGNIFVQTPKPRVGLRPLATVAAYGLLIYGAGQQGESAQAYRNYETAGNEEAAEPFYQKANAANQRYYVATRAAAAIWVTDITLTLIRGFRNQRDEKQGVQPLSYHLNYQANTPVAVLRYTF